MRTAVYVDGENHFLRTREACRRVLGDALELEQVEKERRVVGAPAYPDEDKPIVEANREVFFFWDKHAFDYLAKTYRHAIASYARSVTFGVYATSITGDADKAHEARVWIRDRGFDPVVHHEPSANRKNRGDDGRWKAKTVDVALAVRVLEDAYHEVYEACYLFTSDLDFIPVIQAVKRLGKQVVVCGYQHAIGRRSELEFVPDGFADLTGRVEAYRVAEDK